MLKNSVTILLVVLMSGLIGCAPVVPDNAFCPTTECLKERQLQTRRFDTKDEMIVLNSSAAVLQDLGFNVDEIERDLGVISCSKKRDATSVGQIVGAVFIALLTGAVVPVDDYQIIKASIVTWPVDDCSQVAVRVTFQRVIYNNYKKISTAEAIIDPKIYQEFFEKLSKSIFLEAHQI